MEYSGWNLFDEVTIAVRREGVHQGYVADSRNKSSVNSAIKWATHHNTCEADIYKVKNEGFRIKLLDSAGSSTQGGKLSFWNCLITNEKEGIECVVGINADLLLALMLQNTFVNGYLDKDVCFARCCGEVGMLSSNMKEYTEATRDMQVKKDLNTGKTKKWKVGHNYETLTSDVVYLGSLYRPLIVEDRAWSGYSRDVRYNIMFDENNTEHFVISTDDLKENNITKMSQLRDFWIKLIDDRVEKFKNSSSVAIYNIVGGVSIVRPSSYTNTLPSRHEGDFSIEIDTDLNTMYSEVIKYAQDKMIDLMNSGIHIQSYEFENIITSPSRIEFDNMTENEKTLVSIIEDKRKSKTVRKVEH